MDITEMLFNAASGGVLGSALQLVKLYHLLPITCHNQTYHLLLPL